MQISTVKLCNAFFVRLFSFDRSYVNKSGLLYKKHQVKVSVAFAKYTFSEQDKVRVRTFNSSLLHLFLIEDR